MSAKIQLAIMCARLCVAALLFVGKAHAYFAVVEIDYRWLTTAGVEKEHSVVRCHVSGSADSGYFVRPIPISPVAENVIFPTWSVSPFCPTNFVSATSFILSNRYETIRIVNHPSDFLDGMFAQLARIAYVDPRRCCPKPNSNEWYYIWVESGPYRPEEVSFKIRYSTNSAAFAEAVTAFSPDHIVTGDDSRGRPKKVRFRGAVKTRKLWEFNIQEWKRHDGVDYPAAFTYVRYPDVVSRLEREQLTPIIKCSGKLVEISDAPGERLSSFLEKELEVRDYRGRHLLEYRGNAPMEYQVNNGIWLSEDSTEFRARLSQLKAILEQRRREP